VTRFAGRRALVTGAGSGIGRAVAVRLAEEGARVACLDVAGADAAAGRIGPGAIAVDCDVTDYDAVRLAADVAVSAFGGLDVVCNVAGIGHFANSHEETAEEFDRVVRVNLHGTFHVCRAVLPHLLAGGGGVIVNTASTAGMRGEPWSVAYCASKGGVIQLTRALAVEYLGRNVRVNAVAPGGTNTAIQGSFLESLPADADPKRMDRMVSPLGFAEPEEVAAAFAYVASPEARYMTGAVVTVDGGLCA
jgi:NAD(P)-dependent dehydrogenase (short-subunit alcohol dehydrogenase family)